MSSLNLEPVSGAASRRCQRVLPFTTGRFPCPSSSMPPLQKSSSKTSSWKSILNRKTDTCTKSQHPPRDDRAEHSREPWKELAWGHFLWQRLYFVAQNFIVKKTGLEPSLVPPQPQCHSCPSQGSSHPMELLVPVSLHPPAAWLCHCRCQEQLGWGGDSSWWSWGCLGIRVEIPGEAGALCREPCAEPGCAFLAAHSARLPLAWQ